MIENDEQEDLGLGIIRYSGTDTHELESSGRIRFLDELWLPRSLSELSEGQIFVINRHREKSIELDGRYEAADLSRKRLAHLAEVARTSFVVEIGCGKFPISMPQAAYLGVDIDPEAISFMRAQGYDACFPQGLRKACQLKISTVLSSFALHFSIDPTFLDELAEFAQPDAIFAFSIIVDQSAHLLELLGSLSSEWPIIQVVKTTKMARKECLIVAGKEESASRVQAAALHARLFDQPKV